MHHARRPPRPQTQRGFGLIEALLAFLVLSLGMLAMTRVQSDLRGHAELARAVGADPEEVQPQPYARERAVVLGRGLRRFDLAADPVN